MALTLKTTQRNGWQHQAAHLAVTHTAVGMAATTAAEQTRRQPLLKRGTSHPRSHGEDPDQELEPPKIERLNELEQMRAKLTERETALAGTEQRIKSLVKRVAQLEHRVARETAAVRPPIQLVKMQAEQATPADERVVELEGELGAERDELAFWENENHSLQTSLDLLGNENSRLSQRLAECDSEIDKARSQLEQMKTALIVAEAERSRPASASDEADAKRQTETNTLNTCLAAMSPPAVAAEKLLAELLLRLLARIEHNNAADRNIADAITDRDAAAKKLEVLQNSLQVKERQVQELEQARAELIEATNTLLKVFETRDTALVRAEQIIKLLGERFAQLEAQTNAAMDEQKVQQFNSEQQRQCMELSVAEQAREKVQTICGEPQCDFDDNRRNGRHSERFQVRASESLLAETITFGDELAPPHAPRPQVE
jgi:Crescentin protein